MTLQIASRMCPGAPLGNLRTHLPAVLAALRWQMLHDRAMVLMAIATIRAESAGFELVSESPSRFNTSPRGHAFDLYDWRSDLGNHGPPDGERFRGHGFVQLTGRHNHAALGPRLKPAIDLIAEPERANDSVPAAQILALFLSLHADAIREALWHGDFAAARRLVNGGRHGLDAFVAAYTVGDALMP